MGDSTLRVNFGRYLEKARISHDATIEEVAAGICDPSLITKIESGERVSSLLLRNRLLDREKEIKIILTHMFIFNMINLVETDLQGLGNVWILFKIIYKKKKCLTHICCHLVDIQERMNGRKNKG